MLLLRCYTCSSAFPDCHVVYCCLACRKQLINNDLVTRHLSISHVHIHRLCIIMYYMYVDKNRLFGAFYNCLQISSSAEYTYVHEPTRLIAKDDGLRSYKHYLVSFSKTIAHNMNIREGWNCRYNISTDVFVASNAQTSFLSTEGSAILKCERVTVNVNGNVAICFRTKVSAKQSYM